MVKENLNEADQALFDLPDGVLHAFRFAFHNMKIVWDMFSNRWSVSEVALLEGSVRSSAGTQLLDLNSDLC